MPSFFKSNALLTGAIFCFSVSQAVAQEVSLKSGESVDIGTVYWVAANCKSALKSFVGVDLLDGPKGIELSIREEPVAARRQNCPDKVPGGKVVLRAVNIPEKTEATIAYRVRYDTEDGDKQSSHKAKIALYP